MNKNPFKILSIDGGGIKGLYSATILEKIEEKLKTNTSDHFDLLCGTSTGGLIALALSLKIPASKISQFYIVNGPEIFRSSFKLGKFSITDFGFWKQVLFYGKYSDKHLKLALKEMFEDHLIGESNNLLCIPTYNLTHGDTTVIKYDHPFIPGRDNNARYVDVALATSAAPTYFPLAQLQHLNNDQFIDGGVWANNPVLVGLVEALKYFVGKEKQYDCIEILSISSLNVKNGFPKLRRSRSFRHWKETLFQTSLTGQSKFTDYYMGIISNLTEIPVKYNRIDSHEIAHMQESYIQLDNANKEAIRLIKSMGDRTAMTVLKNPEIIEFFTTKKTYNLK